MRSVYRLCGIATALLLAYACLLSLFSVAGFPASQTTHSFWPWLGNKPIGEDGFYMLTVADNIARTGHITYNYDMPTTGIQPLSTFVFAGLAWIVHHLHGGTWALIRAMILEGAALFVFFAWMMASRVSRLAPPDSRGTVFTFAFFLTLLDYDLFRLFTYGLETGIYLCLIAAAFWLSLRMMQTGKSSWKDAIVLGLLGGFAELARIDFGVLFAILLGWMLLRRVLSVMQTVVCGLTALVICSPWFLFVHSISGAWIPSSGHAESRLIGSYDGVSRIIVMTKAVIVHAFPWVYSNLPQSAALLFGAASLMLMAFLFSRAPRVRAWLRAPDGYVARCAPWMLGVLAFVAIYAIIFSVETFYVRYISVLFIVAMPVVAMICSEQPLLRTKPAWMLGPLAVCFVFYCGSTLHRSWLGNNWLLDAGYIHQYYPEARVGSFQSGTIGYFDRNVVNLDGKLNNDALKAQMNHTMAQYLDREGINVLVEWSGYIHDNLPADYLAREWETCPQPLFASGAICMVRRSAAASGHL
jgi:hypothetical protein